MVMHMIMDTVMDMDMVMDMVMVIVSVGVTLTLTPTLRLKRGMRYGLVGPNDCGKSTLLRSIANGQLEEAGP